MGVMPTLLLAAAEHMRDRLAIAARTGAAAMIVATVAFTALASMRGRVTALGAARIVRTLTTLRLVCACGSRGIAVMLGARLVVRTRCPRGLGRELVAMIAATARRVGPLAIALGAVAQVAMPLGGAVVACGSRLA